MTITRHGRPSAVLVPVDEYEALEETAEILSDDDTLAAIRRGLDDLAAGDEVPLDQVREELADRRGCVVARVFLARSARNALASLDFLLADAVLDALGELELNPEAGYELRGRLTGLWSYRVGVYRIIYERRDRSTLRVVAIRHRGRAYETDPRGYHGSRPGYRIVAALDARESWIVRTTTRSASSSYS